MSALFGQLMNLNSQRLRSAMHATGIHEWFPVAGFGKLRVSGPASRGCDFKALAAEHETVNSSAEHDAKAIRG